MENSSTGSYARLHLGIGICSLAGNLGSVSAATDKLFGSFHTKARVTRALLLSGRVCSSNNIVKSESHPSFYVYENKPRKLMIRQHLQPQH